MGKTVMMTNIGETAAAILKVGAGRGFIVDAGRWTRILRRRCCHDTARRLPAEHHVFVDMVSSRTNMGWR
jgi:hypothetical protein